MTEEQFANMSDEEFAEYENSTESQIPDEEVSEDTEVVPVDGPEEEEEIPADEPEDEESELEDTDTEVDEFDEEDTDGESQETLEEDEETGEEDTQTDTDSSEYKTYYESIMAPIKANGHEVTIKSAADARTLIQKGLNYDDKMVAIKPVRLAGKALERAGIIRDGVIDEDALNRMIDFNNGDIEVVKARLKELEIDPLDLDLDDTNYQASDYVPDEHSVALDDIQRELDVRGSTEKVVTVLNRMDDASKEFFTENPKNLLSLEQDVTNGVFDEIYGDVQYERSMGRLDGVSDMDAYIGIAKQRGAQMREQEAAPAPTRSVNAKKRAKAAGSKPSVSKAANVVNPFDLSDEEFEAQFGGAQALR